MLVYDVTLRQKYARGCRPSGRKWARWLAGYVFFFCRNALRSVHPCTEIACHMLPMGSPRTPREAITNARVCILRCISVRGSRVWGPRKKKTCVYVINATRNAYPRAEMHLPDPEKTHRKACMFAKWRVAELLKEGVRY